MRPPFDIQGHRGARGLVPENTVPSFIEALRYGVHTVELDVIVSADHQLIVSHEPWCSSVTCTDPDGEPVLLEDEESHNLHLLSVEEIQRYDCGRRGHPEFPHQRPQAAIKPTLGEVVRATDDFCARTGRPPCRFNIEVKSRPAWEGIFQPDVHTFAGLVFATLTELDVLRRVTVQSFDPRIVARTRELDPTLTLALLVENTMGLEANLDRLGFDPQIYSPLYRMVDSLLVRQVHARGMRLVPWTVNEAADMLRLHAMKVDGLITDYPNRAAELFKLPMIKA